MNAKQYRKAIADLGLSQIGAARFLGINPSTSHRWLSDQHAIPRPVAMLLRIMIKYELKPDEIEQTALTKKELYK